MSSLDFLTFDEVRTLIESSNSAIIAEFEDAQEWACSSKDEDAQFWAWESSRD